MAFAKGGISLLGTASSLPSEAIAFSFPFFHRGSHCKNARRLFRVLPKFYLQAHRLSDGLVMSSRSELLPALSPLGTTRTSFPVCGSSREFQSRCRVLFLWSASPLPKYLSQAIIFVYKRLYSASCFLVSLSLPIFLNIGVGI